MWGGRGFPYPGSMKRSGHSTMIASLLVLSLAAGCTDTSTRAGGTSPSPSATPRSITVEPLGLSFRLPPSFGVVDDTEHLFLARSAYPPGVLSIEADRPDVIKQQAEGGESLRRVNIGSLDAVIVSDAVLEGLPPGVEARELLVAKGDRSFSLIMSAVEGELQPLWVQFFGSVTIQ